MLHQSWNLKVKKEYPYQKQEGVYINFLVHSEREAFLRGALLFQEELLKHIDEHTQLENLIKNLNVQDEGKGNS